MTKELGQKCAKSIGDQHEEAGNRNGQPPDEATMDYWNNDVGRSIGAGGGDCAQGCSDALKDGRLKVIEGE